MVLIRLPQEMRGELKDPLGPVRTEVEEPQEGRLITVGDIVTCHFLDADVTPDLSLVDGKTKRREVEAELVEKWREVPALETVDNPSGTVSYEMVKTIQRGLSAEPESLIEVEGEEDLAALPAVALAEDGDVVVYGQPNEGMVYVYVDEEIRSKVLDLLERMDIEDEEEFEELLGN
ncbi:MAG: GTP-dependent dephospho-CoA kinase family protein [Halobacteria archaeon]